MLGSMFVMLGVGFVLASKDPARYRIIVQVWNNRLCPALIDDYLLFAAWHNRLEYSHRSVYYPVGFYGGSGRAISQEVGRLGKLRLLDDGSDTYCRIGMALCIMPVGSQSEILIESTHPVYFQTVQLLY